MSKFQATFGVEFPHSFRAYLISRFHCFDEVRSARYDQLILFPDISTRDPFRRLRDLMKSWRILIRADLIPFAEWGDGWGPMCFDVQRRRADGECPILWLDHEEVIPLGDGASMRARLAPLEKPLYDSFNEMLFDVFGHAA